MIKSASAPRISFDTAPLGERAPRASSISHPNDPSPTFDLLHSNASISFPHSQPPPSRPADRNPSSVSLKRIHAAAARAGFRRPVASRWRLRSIIGSSSFSAVCRCRISRVPARWVLIFYSTLCTPFRFILVKLSRAAFSFAGSRGIRSIPGGGSLIIPQKSPSCLMVATNSRKSTGLTT